MLSFRTLLLSSALVIASGGGGFAQVGQPDLVSGLGMVSISRPPETFRLQIAILGRGATLKDALVALKERTAKAQTQLVAMGADKETMKVGDARVTDVNNDRNRQMQMMMAQRMRLQARGAKAAQKAQPAPPIIVSAQLTAEWKLTAKTTEDLLLTVHPLQEKIRAADLAGTKDLEKLSPEQQEMLDEAEQNFAFGSSDEPKPGEPVFAFVARISDADRDKAMAEAFGKAKDQASRLAKAAGAQLGGVKSLSATGQTSNIYDQYGGYTPYMYRAVQMMRQQQAGSDDENVDAKEALGTEAGPVKFNVTVTASFELTGKK